MTNIEKVDYDALYEEVVGHYLGKDFYADVKGLEKYKTTQMEAETLDEYIGLLSEGYINVELSEDFDSYLMELLENEWFYRWPLVHWSYASRLLHGKGIRASKKRAVSILLPMAKAGQPGAMYDIGYCYHYNGYTLERNYERAVCLWLESSKKGYRKASRQLNEEYDNQFFYKELPDELKMFVLYELFMLYIKDYDNDPKKAMESFNERELKRFKKIFNEGKRLQKTVSEKAFMRNMTKIAWDDKDNPYRIDF